MRIMVGVGDLVERVRDGHVGRGSQWSDDQEVG
jgi:hypothetical protein